MVLLMKIQVLEFYAVSTGKLLQTFSVFMFAMDCLTLTVEAPCFSETLASVYQSAQLISQKFEFSCLHWDCTSFTTCNGQPITCLDLA